MPVHFHEGLSPLMESIHAVSQHPDNPNNGDIEAIAESMVVNGVYAPVFAQRSTTYILAGNHRYAALLSLGENRIPVVWLDVDDKTATKIMLADNRTADLAEMDLGALGEILEQMAADDPTTGLLGTGYDEAYLARLREINNDPVTLHLPEEGEEAAEGQTRQITCPSCGYEFGGGR